MSTPEEAFRALLFPVLPSLPGAPLQLPTKCSGPRKTQTLPETGHEGGRSVLSPFWTQEVPHTCLRTEAPPWSPGLALSQGLWAVSWPLGGISLSLNLRLCGHHHGGQKRLSIRAQTAPLLTAVRMTAHTESGVGAPPSLLQPRLPGPAVSAGLSSLLPAQLKLLPASFYPSLNIAACGSLPAARPSNLTFSPILATRMMSGTSQAIASLCSCKSFSKQCPIT